VRTYTEGLRGELAGTGVTVATLHPGPVRTEFLTAAGMDEKAFAASFPKFLWMPSREVAKIGVDALANDRGDVIAGVRNSLSTRMVQAIPRNLLLKVLATQHPGMRRDRRSAL
jgi:short-subunit dehydrogenase